MQVTAIYTAVENPPASDNGALKSGTVPDSSPFSGLLKGLLEGLAVEKPQETAGENQTESPGQGNTESLSMLMLGEPVLTLPDGFETQGLEAAEAAAPCETVGPDGPFGYKAAGGPGLGWENAVTVLAEAPAEAAEGHEISDGIMQAAEKGQQERSVIPPEGSIPKEQGQRAGPGSETSEPAGIPQDTAVHLDGHPKGHPETEVAKQHTNRAKPDNGLDLPGKNIRRPEGKLGGIDPEANKTKTGVIRYDAHAAGPKTGRWSDTQQFSQIRRAQGQEPVPSAFENDVINQVAEKMRVMLGTRKSEISLQLIPESLGRVRIKLTVADGILSGRIVVQNDETRALIQANVAKLQENLEQQGIPVSKFLVDVGRDGGHGQQQFFQGNRQAYHARTELRSYAQDENREILTWRGEGTIELLA